MPKKFIIVILFLIVVAVVLEARALLHEKHSVTTFADYWNEQSKSSTGTITYVALGDSAAQGIGASSPGNGYVSLIAARLAAKTGQQVRVINLSKSGARISDVVRDQLPSVSSYQPDVVTIEIGANDVTKFNSEQFRADFAALVAKLPGGSYVSDMPYFGGRMRANDQAIQASNIIAAELVGHDLYQVKLQQQTRQHDSWRNYAADLFHPSNQGYINWADAFWAQIEPTLPSRRP